MKVDVELQENFINQSARNSYNINHEMVSFLDTQEGQSKKADIELLQSMGFDKKMINKVYILLQPENIERAIDYMSQIDGLYQHDFIEGANPNEQSLCFICKTPRKNHQDYTPNEFLHQNENSNNNNLIDIPQNIDDNLIQEDNKKNIEDGDFAECKVCYDEISQEDKDLNRLKCGHLFCTHCWFNYLKTSISEAKVDKIKCMDHGCNEIVSEEFIFNHIKNNDNLIEKYKKFKKRAEILKDKNKKLCPKPDCDSFLQNSKTTKYVQCEHGHQYCFECLKQPHGDKPCEQNIEKQFLKWKKGKRVKRCPKCQMYTEKKEGCNHMICVSCKYQWCWLCEGEYNDNHYSSGSCRGQQFTRADNLKDIQKWQKAFGLHKIFTCIYTEVNGPIDLGSYTDCIWLRYFLILGFLLFGYGFLYFYLAILYLLKNLHLHDDCLEVINIILTCLIGLSLFVCFQILFTCIAAPSMLICFFYPKLFDRILILYGVGDSDSWDPLF